MANAKADWSAGYITEVPYSAGFYGELAPIFLSYCASQRGYSSPDPHQAYTALELGCGFGLSANLIAAANPQSRFYAVDFNPVHIVWAEEMASENAARNITFLEDSFADMDLNALPQFDFITLHGVLSWVSPSLRKSIVDILERKLKPGGLVYVSYNSLPGWSAMAPVRKLMYELSKEMPGAVAGKVPATINMVKKLIDSKFLYFQQTPLLRKEVEALDTCEPNYLLHEYFNDAWELMYFADVCSELERAKLDFVSSAFPNDNVDAVAWPPGMAEAVEPGTSVVMRETLRDFALAREFRRDIFVRGATRFASFQHLNYLSRIPFYLVRGRHQCDLKVKLVAGEVSLEERFYEPVLDSLDKSPKTFSQLLDELAGANMEASNLLEALNVLMTVNYVAPGRMFDAKDSTVADTRKFNKHLLDRAVQGREVAALSSPALGGGYLVSFLDQLFLHAHVHQAANMVDRVLKNLGDLGRRLNHEGVDLTDAVEERKRLEILSSDFQKTALPIYRTLGIVD